jgi:hypothetical protein
VSAEKSQVFVLRKTKVVYVLNGSTVGSADSFTKIAKRFEFVRRQNPLVDVAVFLSRERDSNQRRVVSARLGLPVHPFCILSPNGEISVDGVVDALCELVRLDHLASADSDAIAAEHLVDLLKHLRSCGSTQLWTSARQVYEHLSSQEECGHAEHNKLKNAAPQSHVLGFFPSAVKFLLEKQMVIPRFGAFSSRFGLELEGANLFWHENDSHDELAVRLPVFDLLCEDVLSGKEDVSARFWGPPHFRESAVSRLEELQGK